MGLQLCSAPTLADFAGGTWPARQDGAGRYPGQLTRDQVLEEESLPRHPRNAGQDAQRDEHLRGNKRLYGSGSTQRTGRLLQQRRTRRCVVAGQGGDGVDGWVGAFPTFAACATSTPCMLLLTMLAMQCSNPMAMKVLSGLQHNRERGQAVRGSAGTARVPSNAGQASRMRLDWTHALQRAAWALQSCIMHQQPHRRMGRWAAHPRIEMNLPPAVCGRKPGGAQQAQLVGRGTHCTHACAGSAIHAAEPLNPCNEAGMHAHLSGGCLPHSEADKPVGQHRLDL